MEREQPQPSDSEESKAAVAGWRLSQVLREQAINERGQMRLLRMLEGSRRKGVHPDPPVLVAAWGEFEKQNTKHREEIARLCPFMI